MKNKLSKSVIDNIIVLICARKNSKGIKNKNILKINKKPLIQYSIDKIKNLGFKYICLSTDSKKIQNYCRRRNINSFFTRPKNLSVNKVPKIKVWKHAIRESNKFYEKNFKYMLDIEITNPLTTSSDLKKFIDFYIRYNKNKQGQICGKKSFRNPYFNILEKKRDLYKISKKINNKIITSRQQAPETYDHIAAFYIFKTPYILKSNSIFDGKINLYNLPFHKSLDLDNNDDLILIKKLLNKSYEKV